MSEIVSQLVRGVHGTVVSRNLFNQSVQLLKC
jgi:hypothetical protein